MSKHVTSYALRRTSNNRLRQAGGVLVAQAVTGHVTTDMTDHYSDYERAERLAMLHAAFGDALGSCTGANAVQTEAPSPLA